MNLRRHASSFAMLVGLSIFLAASPVTPYPIDPLAVSRRISNNAIIIFSVPTSTGASSCGSNQPVPSGCTTNSSLFGVAPETSGGGVLTQGNFSEPVGSNRILDIVAADYDGDVDQSVTVFHKPWAFGASDDCVSYYTRNVQQSDVEGGALSPTQRFDYTESPCLFTSDGTVRSAAGRVYPLPLASSSEETTRLEEQVFVVTENDQDLYYHLFDQNPSTMQLQSLSTLSPGVTVTGGPRNYAVASGDFDGDGVSEFAVVFVTSLEVRLHLVRPTLLGVAGAVPTLVVNESLALVGAPVTAQVDVAASMRFAQNVTSDVVAKDTLMVLVASDGGDAVYHVGIDHSSGQLAVLGGAPVALSTSLGDAGASVTSIARADVAGTGVNQAVALTWAAASGTTQQAMHVLSADPSSLAPVVDAELDVDLGGASIAHGSLGAARVDSGVPTSADAPMVEQVVLVHAPTSSVYAVYLHNVSLGAGNASTVTAVSDPEVGLALVTGIGGAGDTIWRYVQLALPRTVRPNTALAMPAFHLQPDVPHLVAQVDTPPRHFDVQSSSGDDVLRANVNVGAGSLVSASWSPDAQDDELFSIRLRADWATSERASSSGDAALQSVVDDVRSVLLSTVGQQFDRTGLGAALEAVEFVYGGGVGGGDDEEEGASAAVAAAQDDRVVRAFASWGVYEYPIVTRGSQGAAVDHVLVLVPMMADPSGAASPSEAIINASLEVQQQDGRDAGGVVPAHEVNNILTYPAPADAPTQGSTTVHAWDPASSDFSQDQALAHTIDASTDATQSYITPSIGGDGSQRFGPNTGISASSLAESYRFASMGVMQLSLQHASVLSILASPGDQDGSFPSNAAYTVRPHSTFDPDGGHFVLSYAVELVGSAYARPVFYTAPDVTWTLPHRWDGQIYPPVLENTELGEGLPAANAYETPDISASTLTPGAWESLTLSIAIRNIGISTIQEVDPNAQVSVQMYLGDFTNPDNAFGDPIAVDTTTQQNDTSSRRQTVSGGGERDQIYAPAQVTGLYQDGLYCVYGRINVQSELLVDARDNNNVAYLVLYPETQEGANAACGDAIVEEFGAITVDDDDDDDQVTITELLLYLGVAFVVILICICCWVILGLFVYEAVKPRLEHVWRESRGVSLLGEDHFSSSEEMSGSQKMTDLEGMMDFLGDDEDQNEEEDETDESSSTESKDQLSSTTEEESTTTSEEEESTTTSEEEESTSEEEESTSEEESTTYSDSSS